MHSIETEYFKVSLDDTKQVATLYWTKEVKLDEFQRGCRVFTSMFQQGNITKGLIETSKRGALPSEAADWLYTLQSTPGKSEPLHIALVMSEERYQNLIYDYSQSLVNLCQESMHLNYFTKVEEAMDWLLQESPTYD